MAEGVDYYATQSLETAQCIRNSTPPRLFVCRYYDASGGSSTKCLKASEVADLHTAGLGIVACFETCGGSCVCSPCGAGYFTAAQGTFDGQQAHARAVAVGQPNNSPIFFAVDYDASDADLSGAITNYVNAFYNEVFFGGFAVGVYGSYRVVEHAWYNWPGVYARWQTYAWSAGQVSAFANIYQYENGVALCGITVDKDSISAQSDFLW